MTEDTAWLIEHPHDPRYGRESWYSGKDGFTIDSLQAVRFARKEDAVREIDRFPASLAKNLVAAHHIPDDATEDTEWLILHARLTKFLFATGERGLKNLLGTVTMLRERLLEIGNEVLSKQVHEPRDGYLSPVLPSDHVDCR